MSFAVQRLARRPNYALATIALVAIGVLALAQVSLQFAGMRISAVDAGLAHMMLTLLIARHSGLRAGLVVATISCVVLNFVFLEPVFAFSMSGPAHLSAVPLLYISAAVGASLRPADRAFATDMAVPGSPVSESRTGLHSGLHIDSARGQVSLDGETLRLTPTELKLLTFMASNRDRVLRPQAILHGVWGPEYSQDVRVLRTYINQLRTKLGDNAANPRFIRTDPGFGYTFLGNDRPQ